MVRRAGGCIILQPVKHWGKSPYTEQGSSPGIATGGCIRALYRKVPPPSQLRERVYASSRRYDRPRRTARHHARRGRGARRGRNPGRRLDADAARVRGWRHAVLASAGIAPDARCPCGVPRWGSPARLSRAGGQDTLVVLARSRGCAAGLAQCVDWPDAARWPDHVATLRGGGRAAPVSFGVNRATPPVRRGSWPAGPVQDLHVLLRTRSTRHR